MDKQIYNPIMECYPTINRKKMCDTCKNMDESLKPAEQKALHLIEYMIPFHVHEILHKQN